VWVRSIRDCDLVWGVVFVEPLFLGSSGHLVSNQCFNYISQKITSVHIYGPLKFDNTGPG